MQIGANANWPKTHTHLYYMQIFNCDYSISSTDNPPSWTDGFSVLFLAVILDHFGCFFFSFCSSTGNGPGMSQCFITSCDSIGNHCILFGHTEWCVTAPTHFACISSLTPTYYGPSEHTNQSHSAARIDESSLIVVFFRIGIRQFNLTPDGPLKIIQLSGAECKICVSTLDLCKQ